MKKKIMITSWAMELGGVERSLIGLLESLDYSQYEVDLFLCRHEGEFMPFLSSKANLLPEIEAYTLFQTPIKRAFQKGYWRIACNRIYCKFLAKRNPNMKGSMLGHYEMRCLAMMPDISTKEYDLAISFLTPHLFSLHKVNAKKKIAWIHTDYTTVKVDVNFERPMWQAYDHIAGISESSVEAFCKTFPMLKEKTMVIENILSSEFVRQQSMLMDVSDEIAPFEHGITFCTIGRFCEAKAMDNAILICRKLIDKGINLRWYAIGYGGDEPMMRNMIEQYQLQNHFIILGKRDNPYPYMKACDFYLQLSRYEGKSVAVTEAKMLCKPVIITDFPTAVNHLDDGVDGFVVPMEIEACTEAVVDILADKTGVEQVRAYLEQHDYSNGAEVEKIYRFL